MSYERDLCSTERPAKMIDDHGKIGEVLFDSQTMWIRVRVIGETRPTLVPVSHDEALFQLTVEMPEERPLRPAGSPMEPEHYRRASIGTTRLKKKGGAVGCHTLRALDLLGGRIGERAGISSRKRSHQNQQRKKKPSRSGHGQDEDR